MKDKIIRPLTEQQKNEADKVHNNTEALKAAYDVIIDAINEDAKEGDNGVLSPEILGAIYPELWKSIISTSITTVIEHNNILKLKLLGIIKNAVLNDLQKPMVSKEDIYKNDCRPEEVKDDKGSLFTSYGKIDVKPEFVNKGSVSVITNIFDGISRDDLYNDDIVNIVKDCLKKNKTITSVIKNGYITDATYGSIISKLSQDTSNQITADPELAPLAGLSIVVIIEFLLKLFDFNDDLTYYQLLESKFYYIYILSTQLTQQQEVAEETTDDSDNKVVPLFKKED